MNSQVSDNKMSLIGSLLIATMAALIGMAIAIALGDWMPFFVGEMVWMANGAAAVVILKHLRPQTSTALMAVLFLFVLGLTFVYSFWYSWFVLGERI